VTKPGGGTDAVVGRTLETDPEGHTTSYCYNNTAVIETYMLSGLCFTMSSMCPLGLPCGLAVARHEL
jgi:hypothetical protein